MDAAFSTDEQTKVHLDIEKIEKFSFEDRAVHKRRIYSYDEAYIYS